MRAKLFLKVAVIAIALMFIIIAFSPEASTSTVSMQNKQGIRLDSDTGTRTPIKHVINIYLENHSFDNLFGIYPIDNYTANSSISANLSIPLNLLSDRAARNMLTEIPTGTFYTKDPNEGYVSYHLDFNHGKLNGFLKGSGPQGLTYYSAAQEAPQWDIAEQYGLADNFYAPCLSESAPHHLYYVAGYSPIINDYGPPPYIPYSQSIFGELSKYNISYGVYLNNTAYRCASWNFLYGHSHYSSHLQSWNAFLNQTANGTLPAVSYFFSQGTGKSMGPPDNILNGEMLLLYVIDAVEKSPLWNSTAIFITYDGFGGYYDQVVPPVMDNVQLGLRIPLIVISPYAKEDYISNTQMLVTSILGFIDYNWKMPALNKMVDDSYLPLDFFNFSDMRGPIQFNASAGFPVPSNIHFALVTDTSTDNYSGLFPMEPQIPLNTLGYNRSGSSSVNLSSMGVGILNKNEHGYIPFFESIGFYSLLVVVEIAIAAAIVTMYRRR
ncbi:MAG: alkaline phosphatase family protein [Ferroplasma sp.]|uniref:alkaline phosphatase family protein n=1 Tax=Ferroplasma sp. TaxID=2591003 RepID=UPI0028162251|nr:alkaline phosphatase family protein [Ferroplasma sp.]WMT50521.1 MAG: alkaline phosphatase family protein [Ferroplasma sp.]